MDAQFFRKYADLITEAEVVAEAGAASQVEQLIAASGWKEITDPTHTGNINSSFNQTHRLKLPHQGTRYFQNGNGETLAHNAEYQFMRRDQNQDSGSGNRRPQFDLQYKGIADAKPFVTA